MTGIVCGILVLLFPFQSKHAFKSFYEEGDVHLERRQYTDALARYQEAFRLEPKAQRYKEEGAFFRNYLPRYKIALCYEQLDLLEAETWVRRSKEALEEEVIRRQKKAVADYHADLERIEKAAETHRAELGARYELALRDADQFLLQNQFAKAKTAYEALYKRDPSRTEATVGLARIGPARINFLKGKMLDARSALLAGEFDRAEILVDQAADVDPDYSELSVLTVEIRKAREAALKREGEGAVASPVRVVERAKEPESGSDEPPISRSPDRPRKNVDSDHQKRKTLLRAALLETLKPYRRGDPMAALSRLNEIEAVLAAESPSYYWLKGLYLLTAHHGEISPDKRLLERAGNAMARAQTLSPSFEPDPEIYPRYVIEFFKSVKR